MAPKKAVVSANRPWTRAQTSRAAPIEVDYKALDRHEAEARRAMKSKRAQDDGGPSAPAAPTRRSLRERPVVKKPLEMPAPTKRTSKKKKDEDAQSKASENIDAVPRKPLSGSKPSRARAGTELSDGMTGPTTKKSRKAKRGPAAKSGVNVGSRRPTKNGRMSRVTARPPAGTSEGENSARKKEQRSVSKTNRSDDARSPTSALRTPPPGDGWRKRGHYDHWINRIVDPQHVVSGRISKRFPSAVSRACAKGFHNFGTTCYRNAMLQAMLHAPVFYHFLGNVHANCNLMSDTCTTCVVQKIAEAYTNPPHTMADHFSSLMSDFLEALRTSIPQDANADMPGASFARELWFDEQSDSFDFYKALAAVIRSQTNESARATALSQDFFEMQTKTVWHCPEHHRVEANHPMPELGMDVNIQEPRLNLSLAEYLKLSHFIEEGNFDCDTCGDRYVDRRKNVQIVKAPHLLVLRLARFSIRPADYEDEEFEDRSIRLNNVVPFEEFLDLSSYTSDDSSLVYRLDSIVYHRGADIEAGHYIAAVRNTNYSNWSMLDDELLAGDAYTFNEVQGRVTTGDGVGDFDPYVLVYSRIS